MNTPTLIASAAATGTVAAVAVQEVVVAATGGHRSTADIIQIVGVVSTAVIGVATVIGGIVVQIISARIKVAVANAIAPIAVAVADVDVKAGAIKASVDGTASRMEATLAAALRENERLRAERADQSKVAAVLAATASSAQSVPLAQPPIDGPVSALVEVQEKIEVNTRETASAVKHLEKDGPE